MHDPMTVAFEIPNPLARRYTWATRWSERPALVTVWHRDPHDDDGRCRRAWIAKGRRGLSPYIRHLHHWKIQIHPIQNLKRWLFSRCETCGRMFRWGQSPVARGWSSTGPRWFRGEDGVRHPGCPRQVH